MKIFPREKEHSRNDIYNSIFGHAKNQRVLDFGGNSGNLLYFSGGMIKDDDYVCVDLDQEALEQGKKEYPNAHWVRSHMYHPCYNPYGELDTPFPELPFDSFDNIFSYSIFSHSDLNQLVDTIIWMQRFNPNIIAHSILLTTDTKIMNWFYSRRISEYGNCIDFGNDVIECDSTISIIDNSTIIKGEHRLPKTKCNHLITFYDKEYLLKTLKEYDINAEVYSPSNSFQSYLVIKNAILRPQIP